MKKKVAIIGGGAAGMMVAATLCECINKYDIHLYERNSRLGKKVMISGGGRCNVTTGLTDFDILLTKYTRGAVFLKPALKNFGPQKIYKWFEAHGVPLKTEKDLRVFPVSDNGEDIVSVFEKMFDINNISLHLKETVSAIFKKDLGKGSVFVLTTDRKKEEFFDYLILTTGGNAYAHTGSHGDGYAFSRALGHNITRLGPSLNSFTVSDSWVKDLKGVSFQNARLRVGMGGGNSNDNMKIFDGPVLFTHTGITGPAIFTVSSHLAFTKISSEKIQEIFFIPDAVKNVENWDNDLRDIFEKNGNRIIHTILSDFLPRRFVDVVCDLVDMEKDIKTARISKKLRKKIALLLGNGFTIHLTGRSAGSEFVTAGGVDTSEVDSKTGESKNVENLYFAGEILDVDGVTGGFNLTASWAVGRLVGKSILKKIA